MEDMARRQSMMKKRKLKRGAIGICVMASGYTWAASDDQDDRVDCQIPLLGKTLRKEPTQLSIIDTWKVRPSPPVTTSSTATPLFLEVWNIIALYWCCCIDSDRESFYYYRLKAEVVIFTFASMPKVPKTTNPAKIEVREFPKAISQASLEVNCHGYCYIKLGRLWQLLVNELYEERSSWLPTPTPRL